MTDCAKCGHELSVGRYCTNCGEPAGDAAQGADFDWRTGTAERPRTPAAPPSAPPASSPPASPPPAWTPPPAPRFPLYADEIAEPELEDTATDHRRPRSTGGWVALAVVLVLVLLIGVWLVTTGDDDEPPASGGTGSSAPATGDEPVDQTDDEPSAESSPPAPTGLTAESEVTVPATAEPGADVDGNPVGFDGTNMLDGVPETCWRMPGDGTGQEIVVTLPRETRLRSVGMINGYAKQGGDVDWYHGNRRVEQVEWVFDDGTAVPQTFGDTPSVQSMDVDVTTTTVTIRLIAVSEPGKGPSRRDFTAISDLLFVAR